MREKMLAIADRLEQRAANLVKPRPAGNIANRTIALTLRYVAMDIRKELKGDSDGE